MMKIRGYKIFFHFPGSFTVWKDVYKGQPSYFWDFSLSFRTHFRVDHDRFQKSFVFILLGFGISGRTPLNEPKI